MVQPALYSALQPLACDVTSFAIGLRPHLLALRCSLIDLLGGRTHEELWAFLVDRDNYICAAACAPGEVDCTRVPFRELLYWAMQREAHGLLLAHNHPSGNPSPSPADVQITRSLAATCRLLNWTLWDHIIVGGETCYSFRDAGLM